jgi:hypothetical protein
MKTPVENARESFHDMVRAHGSDPFGLLSHIEEIERWARIMIKKHPEADEEVILLGVFLHDIGHYPIDKETDHAVTSERIARKLLTEWGVDEKKAEKVLHCIRAHRCKDVQPETIEAKIIACIDSASHLTDRMYLDIVRDGRTEYALGKLDRDYRDLSHFPEIKEMTKELYESWKRLLHAYSKIREQK